jgi:pterin-4a-carbinolamine dehydratase
LKNQLHPEWKLRRDECYKLTRTFVMKNFVSALSFLNQVGELAETLGHHPGLFFFCNFFPDKREILMIVVFSVQVQIFI